MVKFIKQGLELNSMRLVSVLTLIYFCLFNSAVLLYKFGAHKDTLFRSFIELGKESIFTCAALFVIFLGLAIHRKLLTFSAIFLFLTGAVSSYALYMHSVRPTEKILGALYQSSFSDIMALMSIRLIVWLVFSSAVLFYCLKYFAPAKSEAGFFMKLISSFCLLVTVNNIISPQFMLLTSYFPLQYLHNSFMYITNL